MSADAMGSEPASTAKAAIAVMASARAIAGMVTERGISARAAVATTREASVGKTAASEKARANSPEEEAAGIAVIVMVSSARMEGDTMLSTAARAILVLLLEGENVPSTSVRRARPSTNAMAVFQETAAHRVAGISATIMENVLAPPGASGGLGLWSAER